MSQKTSLEYSRELCELAAKWLKRPTSQGGHGCQISFVEGCAPGENADAIGFRHSRSEAGSVLVEVKVSRADLLKDSKKPFRIRPEKGMGKWRYYLCPENLIKIDDLPEKWGLIYVTKGNRLKVVRGAAIAAGSYKAREENFRLFEFKDYDLNKEQILLIKSLTRFKHLDDMIKLQRHHNKLSMQFEELRIGFNKSKLESAVFLNAYQNKIKELVRLNYRLELSGVPLPEFPMSKSLFDFGPSESMIKYHFDTLENMLFYEELQLKRASDEDAIEIESFINFIKKEIVDLEAQVLPKFADKVFLETGLKFSCSTIKLICFGGRQEFTEHELTAGMSLEDAESLLVMLRERELIKNQNDKIQLHGELRKVVDTLGKKIM